MDKIRKNKFVVKAKEIWKKHKVVVSIAGAIVVLLCVFGFHQANSKVDPLADVQHVVWNPYSESWVIPGPERAQIATKMRIAVFKKYDAKSQTIKSFEDNPKWYYGADDYKTANADIGVDKTNEAIKELDSLKDGLKLEHDNSGKKLILKIDVPQDQANKDGIKLANREFSTDEQQ